jgi:hypothetical protein
MVIILFQSAKVMKSFQFSVGSFQFLFEGWGIMGSDGVEWLKYVKYWRKIWIVSENKYIFAISK